MIGVSRMETRQQSEIIRLRTLVEIREAELRTLRSASSDVPLLVLAFGLSVMQANMVSLLMSRQAVSREAMATWLYGLQSEPTNARALDKHTARLRRRLPPNAGIETIPHFGWRMSEAAKAVIARHLDDLRSAASGQE